MNMQTDTNDFNPNFVENAFAKEEQKRNDLLPHYGMSFLLPIPVGFQTPQNAFGDFSSRDQNGNHINSFNWFPAFELMPFYGVNRQIPPERPSEKATEVPTPEPYQISSWKKQNTVDRLIKNPRQCADTFYSVHKERGAFLFESLIGLEQDARLEIKLIRNILQVLLPLKDPAYFDLKKVRMRAGVRFTGPFLDEIITDFSANAQNRVDASDLPDSVKDFIFATNGFYQEIRMGLSIGEKLANRLLNDTEAEMKNPDGTKKDYDLPNLDVVDAGEPTDLLCLVHTNREEIANKPLEASANIGRELAGAITEALGGKNKIEESNETGEYRLTQSEVDLQLEQERKNSEERMAKLDEELARRDAEIARLQELAMNQGNGSDSEKKDSEKKDSEKKETKGKKESRNNRKILL